MLLVDGGTSWHAGWLVDDDSETDVLLRDHGTWELGDVLAFAIGYARDGHPVLGRVGATIAAVADLFTDHWPTSAALWMPEGRPPREGEVIRNEAYARVLGSLVDAGADPAASTRAARIDAARREIVTLRLASGEGCVTLLRHDLDRDALLLERLGPSMADLGLPLAFGDALQTVLKEAVAFGDGHRSRAVQGCRA